MSVSLTEVQPILRILINGELRDVKENISIPELIASLSLKVEQVAVEVNQNVVRRTQWESTVLQPDDRVEIVHFVGGGCRSGGRSSRQAAGGGL